MKSPNEEHVNAVGILRPGHPNYAQVSEVLETQMILRTNGSSRDYYNDLMTMYNKQKVGEILVFQLPIHFRYSNLRAILEGRGLERDVDYLIGRSDFTASGEKAVWEERPVLLKRISEAPGKIFSLKSVDSEEGSGGD